MRMTLDDIDLLEDTWAREVPNDQFELLRRVAPVHWHEHPEHDGFWAVTRHADVRTVSRDHHTFSTELGSTFIQDFPAEALEMVRMTLLNMDPPRHSRYRRLVSAGFTPRMIGRLIDHIHARAVAIVDGLEGRDEVEFVQEVAAELPLQIICEMIGVPDEDRHLVFDWSNRLVGFQDTDFQTSEEDGRIAAAEIYAYCDAIAADRRARPRDDIMSVLVHAELDGDHLSPQELNMFFVLLCVAGNETTRNLIAHAMLALVERPDVRADLAVNIDDDALWGTATEEFLRWGSSIHNFRRTATCDTEVGGQAIKQGEKLVVYYASANRDASVFLEPQRFDIRRDPNDHLTFGGGGAHFCLGANLARAEITVMVREFLRRYPDLTLAGPPRRMRSDFINGIKALPVRLSS